MRELITGAMKPAMCLCALVLVVNWFNGASLSPYQKELSIIKAEYSKMPKTTRIEGFKASEWLAEKKSELKAKHRKPRMSDEEYRQYDKKKQLRTILRANVESGKISEGESAVYERIIGRKIEEGL